MAAPAKIDRRTIRIELPEPYTGYWVSAKADFPARVLVELQSGEFERTLEAFTALVIDHNLPGSDGKKAVHMLDVDPFDMVQKAIAGWGDELGKLQRQ